jgi:hypothetical protein
VVEAEAPGAARLRDLAALPAWRRWTLASFLGRLPLTMSLLALQLAGYEATGSLATGALLAGTATGVSALAAPLRGRQLDRNGLRGGLRRASTGLALALLAQVAALRLGAPVPVLFVLAAAQGVVGAAVQGGFRALLTPVVPAAQLPRASTLDAVFVEVAFIAGPALAGVLALGVGATGVVGALPSASAGCALVTGGLPTVAPAARRTGPAPWRTPIVMVVLGLGVVAGTSLGAMESAVAALVATLGADPELAGPLLTFAAAGSAVGGILASSRVSPRLASAVPAAVLFAAFGLLLLPAAAAPSLLLLGVALFAVGLPIAPLNALGSLRLQAALPVGGQGEGFAAWTAAILLGAGLGQSATGLLLEPLGSRAVLMVAAIAPVITAGVLLVNARRSAPPRVGAVPPGASGPA